MVGIAPLDPHTGFIASDDIGSAQCSQRIVAPRSKDRRGTLEHVHQRALAERQPEQIGKGAWQPFVGEQLVRFEVERQGMDALAKGRAMRGLWQGRSGFFAARRATAL